MKLSLPILSLVTLTVFLINSPLVLAETNGIGTNPTSHGHDATSTADLKESHDSSSSSDLHGNKESTSSDHGKGTVTSCQNRQNEIKTRMSNMSSYITKNESTLDSLASRVEGYYTTKFVPIGATISNYDSLTADISSKSATLKSALTLAQTDASSFNCDKNPKDQVKKFNIDIDTAKKDLRTYQKSIQTLIKAIRGLIPNTHLEGEKEGSRSGSISGHLK